MVREHSPGGSRPRVSIMLPTAEFQTRWSVWSGLEIQDQLHGSKGNRLAPMTRSRSRGRRPASSGPRRTAARGRLLTSRGCVSLSLGGRETKRQAARTVSQVAGVGDRAVREEGDGDL